MRSAGAVAEIESELEQAAVKSERTGKRARCFKDFVWSRQAVPRSTAAHT
jgi:hypothetical protein